MHVCIQNKVKASKERIVFEEDSQTSKERMLVHVVLICCHLPFLCCDWSFQQGATACINASVHLFHMEEILLM